MYLEIRKEIQKVSVVLVTNGRLGQRNDIENLGCLTESSFLRVQCHFLVDTLQPIRIECKSWYETYYSLFVLSEHSFKK